MTREDRGYGYTDGVRWVRDRETGEVLPISHDQPFSDEIKDFYAGRCEHPERTVMRVPVASGGIQVRECCTVCGMRFGNALKQTDPAWVASLPLQASDHEQTYETRRRNEEHAILLKHARRQEAERGRFTAEYRDYLRSPEWQTKREKVISRCGNVCEGCGDAPVQHVHHTTYAHLGNEFLFELLGLCRECHDRLHADDEGPSQ